MRPLIGILLQIVIVSPLLVFALDRNAIRWKNLTLLAVFLLLYWSLLLVPTAFPALKLMDGTWNWSGKLYAILGSVLFYFAARQAFGSRDFVRFQWNNPVALRNFWFLLAIFVGSCALAFSIFGKTAERLDYLLFQSTLPGLDEELAFRGILLGLMSNMLKPAIALGRFKIGNPALWISAAFFALGHSFTIDSQCTIHQNWFEFFNVLAIGSLLGWLTLKGGNIWTAVLVHNLFNVVPKLLFWL